MAILLKNNVVFLHIPKTGGSWIVKTIKENGLHQMTLGPSHADYERVVNYSGHYLGSYLKNSIVSGKFLDSYLRNCQFFCFVREPISYYESLWRFLYGVEWRQFSRDKSYSKLGLKADSWHPWKQLEHWGKVDFHTFISKIIEEMPGYLSNLYTSYIPYNSGVRFGKQENLKTDFMCIAREIYGQEIVNSWRFPKEANCSKVEKPQWNDDLKKEIVRLEYPVYSRFNYDPPM